MSIKQEIHREYGVPVTALPEKFQAEIKRFDLAKDGIWRVIALNTDDARANIKDTVSICTREKVCDNIDPQVILKVKNPKKKTAIQHWNLTKTKESV